MRKSIEELITWEDVNRCLKEIGECEIVKIGASKKLEDKFWCEVDRENIKG